MTGSTFLMLSVHVDDQLIACNSCSTFKQTLNSKLECSDSGPAGYFLGFNIYRKRPAALYCRNNTDLVDCLERVALQPNTYFASVRSLPHLHGRICQSNQAHWTRESTTIQSVFLMFPQQTTLTIYSPIVHLPACRTYLKIGSSGSVRKTISCFGHVANHRFGRPVMCDSRRLAIWASCATLGDSWRKRGFAVVVRYAIVTCGLIAFRTPRLPRFTFCATAEIET